MTIRNTKIHEKVVQIKYNVQYTKDDSEGIIFMRFTQTRFRLLSPALTKYYTSTIVRTLLSS